MEIKKNLIVGITGGISSGKSLVSEFLSEKGYLVLNADQIAKEFLYNDAAVKNSIEKLFGNDAYKDGKPDIRFLSANVFSNPTNVLKMNRIIHPLVIGKLEEIIKARFEKNPSEIIFVEAALIFEAEMETLFDFVVLIKAPVEMRIERAMQKLSLSRDEVVRRMENQIADAEKEKGSDISIDNSGSTEDLKKKTEFLVFLLHGIQNKK